MATISVQKRERMDQIATGLDTKSEKMRRLAAEGFKRAEIARYLGVRYQFVYNVLSAPVRRPKGKGEPEMAPAQKVRENPQEPSDGFMGASKHWVWTKLDKEGRISLPAAFREALDLREGDDVQLLLTEDGVRVFGRAAALRSLQEDVRRYVPEGVSLVDELIADRRAEADRENASG